MKETPPPEPEKEKPPQPQHAPWWTTLPPVIVAVMLLVGGGINLIESQENSEGFALMAGGLVSLGVWLALESRR